MAVGYDMSSYGNPALAKNIAQKFGTIPESLAANLLTSGIVGSGGARDIKQAIAAATQPTAPQAQASAPMSFMPANPMTMVPFMGQDMNALAALLAQNQAISPQDYFGSMSINPRYQNYLG